MNKKYLLLSIIPLVGFGFSIPLGFILAAGSPIDIGDAAINRTSYAPSAGYTRIDHNNPANASGTIDTVQVYFNNAATQGLKIGTFHEVSSGNFELRAYYATTSSVASGTTQTFTGLNIQVEAGDYLGIYFATGTIVRDASGINKVYYLSGDNFQIGVSKTYTQDVGWTAYSLYGSGFTTPTSLTCSDHNVWGWAWSENVGWLSMSCTNTVPIGTGIDYGVDIDPITGVFSGYAWSENIGWVSFNQSDLTSCPSGTCEAKVLTTGEVSGWARACTVFQDKDACSGALDPNRGGWDGWIKLAGNGASWNGSQCTGINDYLNNNQCNWGAKINAGGPPSEFSGWAWGGDDNNQEAVTGWVSFNCKNCVGNVCGSSYPICGDINHPDYKVLTSLAITPPNQPPVAAISCTPSSCTVYENDVLVMNNESTDPDNNITTSEWDILSTPNDPDTICNGSPENCDFTPQNYENNPGSYTVELKVIDSDGASAIAIKDYTIKKDAHADFMCSLDNSTWQVCESLSVSQGQLVYFKDYSTASDGANLTTPPASKVWKINGNIFDSDNNPNPSTNLIGASNTIRLTVIDSANRSDYQEHTIGAKPSLPKWKEIPPFILLNRFLAMVSNVFYNLFYL